LAFNDKREMVFAKNVTPKCSGGVRIRLTKAGISLTPTEY